MSFKVVLLAFALMLIFEGLGPLFFPNRWRAYMSRLANENVATIRQIGVALVLIGAFLFYVLSN